MRAPQWSNIKQIFYGKRKHFWSAAAVVALMDQATKILFFSILSFEPPWVIIPGYFRIVLRTNPAAAFSLGPEIPLFYVVATIIGLGALIWFLTDVPPKCLFPVLGLGAIGGGAIGNLLDRIFLGEVRDFLDFHWQGRYHWPAFNVADAAICVGVAIILVYTFLGADREKAEEE